MQRLLIAVGVVAGLAGLANTLPARVSAQANGGAWVTLRGRITLQTKFLHPKQIRDVPPHFGAAGLVDDYLLVNPENRGFANVFVWVIPEEGGKLPIHPRLRAVNKQPVVIDTTCCKFEPRCVALREGQPLELRNTGRDKHLVRLLDGAGIRVPRVALLPPGTPQVVQALQAQPQPLRLRCDVHEWMQGCVGVFKHPYYAVTDKDGCFEIPLVPHGNYRLVIYHESGYRRGKLGKNGEPITIQGQRDMNLGDLQYNVPK